MKKLILSLYVLFFAIFLPINITLSQCESIQYVYNGEPHEVAYHYQGYLEDGCGHLNKGIYYMTVYRVTFVVYGDFTNAQIHINQELCSGWDDNYGHQNQCPWGDVFHLYNDYAILETYVYHLYTFPNWQDLGYYPCNIANASVSYTVCKNLPTLTFGSGMTHNLDKTEYYLPKGQIGYFYLMNNTNINCYDWCLKLCDPDGSCLSLPLYNFHGIYSTNQNNGPNFWLRNVSFDGYPCQTDGGPYTMTFYEKLTVQNHGNCGSASITSPKIIPLTYSVGGCPWIWVYGDSGLVPENNVFHKSEFDEFYGNDITDLYLLQNKPMLDYDGNIIVELSEAANDYSMFDQAQMFAVDHPEGTKIGITENNDIVLYNTDDIISTDNAIQNEIRNITNIIQYGYSGPKVVKGESTDSIYAHYDSTYQNRVLKDFKRNVKNRLDYEDSLALIGRLGHNEDYIYPINHQKDWAGNVTIYTETGEASKYFSRRENNADIIIPFGDISDAVEYIDVDFTSDYEVTYFSIVPVSYYGFDQTELDLISAEHDVAGDISSTIRTADQDYAYLDTTGIITLKFQDIEAPQEGYVRDYVVKFNGHYTIPDYTSNMVGSNNVIQGHNQNINLHTFNLYNNYPNPFNPVTSIKYTIPKDNNVSLKVYNALGQLVATLVQEYQHMGEYSINFDGANYPSGIYFYRLESGDFVSTKKMVLIK